MTDIKFLSADNPDYAKTLNHFLVYPNVHYEGFLYIPAGFNNEMACWHNSDEVAEVVLSCCVKETPFTMTFGNWLDVNRNITVTFKDQLMDITSGGTSWRYRFNIKIISQVRKVSGDV